MEKSTSINISLFGYTFTQTLMLFLYYGLNYNMPKWVVWFPSIILGIGLSIIAIILLIIVIVFIISEW